MTVDKILQLDGITYSENIGWDFIHLQEKELNEFIENRVFEHDTLFQKVLKIRRMKGLFGKKRKFWEGVYDLCCLYFIEIESDNVVKARRLLKENLNDQKYNGYKFFKILYLKPLRDENLDR